MPNILLSFRRPPLVEASLAGLLVSLPLFGQSAVSPTKESAASGNRTLDKNVVEMSPFEVTDSEDVGYQSSNAAEVTRMNTPIENIPMNVTVFNQQFIGDLLATDTSELLAYEASSAKTTENDGFLLRGSSSAGSNFLNGFAQTTGNGSQPLANVDRVEVIRGPAAVLYGSGGYGGTINRITKQPKDNPFGSLRLIVRDRETYRTEFDLNPGKIPYTGGKLLFRINGIYEDGVTWFGQNKKERSYAPSLKWNIGPRTKVVFEYLYNWRETQGSWETPVHAGDPKGITTGDGVYHVMPRKINWNNPELADDYRHQTWQVASYSLQHSFLPNLHFRSQFQYESKVQRIYELQALSAALTILKDTALMPRGLRNLPRDTDNWRTRNELVWELGTGPLHHRLLFGHGWIKQDDLNQGYLATRHYGGITNPTYLYGNGLLSNANAGPTYNYFPNITYAQFLANPNIAGFNLNAYMPINMFDREHEGPAWLGEKRPLEALDAYARTVNISNDVYANDVFSVFGDRVYVMAGARYSDNERRTTNYVSGSFPNKKFIDSPATTTVTAFATTYSTGLVWHLNKAKTLSLYGNLNSSFSPEFRIQPDGSDLKPEEGKQKEVGLRFSLLQGRITGLISYFDLLQDNVTRSDPNRPGEGYYIQENGQRSTGVELSWNARITDSWLVFGGFSDTDARNELTGLAQALQPQYRFTMFNRYNVNSGALKGLNLNLGAVYTGERPQTVSTERGEPAWDVPEWWRLDFIVGYGWRSKSGRYRYDLSAKVTNLLDNQDIYYVASNSRYTIDPGREWSVVCGVRF